MKSLILLCAFFYLSRGYSNSQGNKSSDSRMKAVTSVIAGYNRGDYKAMQKHWVGWAKIFVTKRKLKKEYGAYYTRFGAATIDTVTFDSKYQYIAKLNLEKDLNSHHYFSFIFSENGKIEGFGETFPPLIYKKCIEKKAVDSAHLTEKINYLLEKYLTGKTQSFNGSIMLLDDGKPIYKKHVGYINYHSTQTLNDSSLFNLASVSKQFTATAVLMLEQRGLLRLSDSIQRFIPDFPYHGISIAHLLTHTSGLPDYLTLFKKHWDPTKMASNSDIVNCLKVYHPKAYFLPNERFEYCNTGYALLAVIIEKVSQRPFGEFLTDNIFKSLAMKRTGIYNFRNAKEIAIDNFTTGYVYSEQLKRYLPPDSIDAYRHVNYLDAICGDGGIFSSIHDLMLWESELLNPTILSKSLLEKAFSNHQLNNGNSINYGFGYFLHNGKGTEPLVFHTGGWPGYFSIVMNFFEEKKQIVILCNNSYDDFTRIADDIACFLLGN